MRKVRATVDVVGSVADAEGLWYDLHRWPGFVEGFGTVVRRDDEWPRGGVLVWDSKPGGRGRVLERVVRWAPRDGQIAEVEDGQLTGVQTIAFAPIEGGGARVELSLAYSLKRGGPFMAVADLLYIRRAVGDSLNRTLVRFARERRGDEELGLA